jgi:plastocyanin
MRGSFLILLLGLWALAMPGLTWAAPIKGTVALPQELKAGRKYLGHWRLENGIVPIQAPASRGDTVIVLSGVKGQAPSAKTVTVEISGFQAVPSTVVIGEGSVVEFKNSDRVPHDLSIPDQSSLMPIQRLTSGGVRRQKFSSAGAYAVRCAEYPHMVISVVVVGSPYFGVVDEKGGFKLPDVPDGKATLKVWSHGRWVHEEEIEVGSRSGDLKIKVRGEAAQTSAE